ncbi:hypothetical protein HF086_006324 [Spodoptera exigua]|uniref:Uncharacterized protein n=1 Tax=Spodoptera exigua TaxID=7107 RepID=A0A922SL16_SPOEX|nr:hypothetical protein HF086_006324 [Spodoptera exigua]
MDGIQMEPIGKYKADRNGSAKDTDKAREARELRDAPVAVCSQRRALCLTVVLFSAMFATALIIVYASPQSGEVSIDFKVDRDTTFVVLNVRDMNVTERALFKSGGSLGPKVAKTLEYPQADQRETPSEVQLHPESPFHHEIGEE